jgi:hypothetical protein
MTIIWVQSRAAGPTVEALSKLVASKDHAQAYQIAFDLYEIAPQGFVTEVRQGLVSSGLGPDQALVSSLLFFMESADESGRKRCPKCPREYIEWCRERQVPTELYGKECQDGFQHTPECQGMSRCPTKTTSADE